MFDPVFLLFILRCLPLIRFLSEIDESLEASRKVFRDFELLTHGPKQEDIDWEEVQVSVRLSFIYYLPKFCELVFRCVHASL